MRRALLRSTVAVVATALLLFALPLGFVLGVQLRDQALDELTGSVRQVAAFVDQRARTCGELQLILTLGVAQNATALALFDDRGQLALDLTPDGQGSAFAPDVLEVMRTGQTATSTSDGELHASVPLSTGVCRAGLILRGTTSSASVDASARTAWAATLGGALLVLAVAAGVADLLGRRLASPFEELARSARRLGDGDFTTRAPRSGLPEADAIAEALDATASRLGRALDRGNTFTTDAAHQLRTPLTALQLELEVLAATPTDGEALAAARAATDRLAATVEELVSLTRPEGAPTAVDLGRLLGDRLSAWDGLAAAAGRRVLLAPARVPAVLARPAAVVQALDVLVDNALEHGTGAVTITLEEVVAAAGAAAVRLCVVDEGTTGDGARESEPASSGTSGDAAGPGRGHGLRLARSLVEAEGGRLVFSPGATRTSTCLLLPTAGVDGEASEHRATPPPDEAR